MQGRGEVWTNESWVFCGRWQVTPLSCHWLGVHSTTELPEQRRVATSLNGLYLLETREPNVQKHKLTHYYSTVCLECEFCESGQFYNNAPLSVLSVISAAVVGREVHRLCIWTSVCWWRPCFRLKVENIDLRLAMIASIALTPPTLTVHQLLQKSSGSPYTVLYIEYIEYIWKRRARFLENINSSEKRKVNVNI